MATEPARLTDQQRREMSEFYAGDHWYWRFSDRYFASLVLLALAELETLREERDQLRASLERLRTALAVVVDTEPMLAKPGGWLYIDGYEEERWCKHCYRGDETLVWRHGEPERHAPDCPVLHARRTLKGIGGE